jgi:hypothetical protein
LLNGSESIGDRLACLDRTLLIGKHPVKYPTDCDVAVWGITVRVKVSKIGSSKTCRRLGFFLEQQSFFKIDLSL